jgi:hypothetical protein
MALPRLEANCPLAKTGGPGRSGDDGAGRLQRSTPGVIEVVEMVVVTERDHAVAGMADPPLPTASSPPFTSLNDAGVIQESYSFVDVRRSS